jgi:hypothetical protein
MMNQLIEKLSQLSISDSTQISEVFLELDSSSATPEEINPESNQGSTPEVPSPFLLGLCNVASTY